MIWGVPLFSERSIIWPFLDIYILDFWGGKCFFYKSPRCFCCCFFFNEYRYRSLLICCFFHVMPMGFIFHHLNCWNTADRSEIPNNHVLMVVSIGWWTKPLQERNGCFNKHPIKNCCWEYREIPCKVGSSFVRILQPDPFGKGDGRMNTPYDFSGVDSAWRLVNFPVSCRISNVA